MQVLSAAQTASGPSDSVGTQTGCVNILTVEETSTGKPIDSWNVVLQYRYAGETEWKLAKNVIVRRANASEGKAFVLPEGVEIQAYVNNLSTSTLRILIN